MELAFGSGPKVILLNRFKKTPISLVGNFLSWRRNERQTLSALVCTESFTKRA